MNGKLTESSIAREMSNEECEANLSALIDGELELNQILPTLDHLVENPQCRKFYREARELQSRLGAGAFIDEDTELETSTWNKIENRIEPSKSARIYNFVSRNSPIWAAAAAIILVVGLWSGGFLKLVGLQPKSDGVTIQLEENQGAMDEERFVELTSELLRADRRYHRKMLDVMEAVNGRGFIQEGSMENNSFRSSAEQTETQPAGNANRSTGSNVSDLIDIRLW